MKVVPHRSESMSPSGLPLPRQVLSEPCPKACTAADPASLPPVAPPRQLAGFFVSDRIQERSLPALLAIMNLIVTGPHHPKSLTTMPQPTDDISRALAYALDPGLWARDVVGWTPDPWQERLLHSAATQLVLCCGRQVGKSTVVAQLACHTAVFNDDALIILIAPSLRQSRELAIKVGSLLGSLEPHEKLEEANKLSIRLASAGEVRQATVSGKPRPFVSHRPMTGKRRLCSPMSQGRRLAISDLSACWVSAFSTCSCGAFTRLVTRSPEVSADRRGQRPSGDAFGHSLLQDNNSARRQQLLLAFRGMSPGMPRRKRHGGSGCDGRLARSPDIEPA